MFFYEVQGAQFRKKAYYLFENPREGYFPGYKPDGWYVEILIGPGDHFLRFLYGEHPKEDRIRLVQAPQAEYPFRNFLTDIHFQMARMRRFEQGEPGLEFDYEGKWLDRYTVWDRSVEDVLRCGALPPETVEEAIRLSESMAA